MYPHLRIALDKWLRSGAHVDTVICDSGNDVVIGIVDDNPRLLIYNIEYGCIVYVMYGFQMAFMSGRSAWIGFERSVGFEKNSYTTH